MAEKVTLWDYVTENPGDYDVYDDEYDIGSITVVSLDMDEEDYTDYERFIREILKRVHLKARTAISCMLVAEWSEFISRNERILREYAEKKWEWQCKRLDDFIEQWMIEIELYFAGYLPEDEYTGLLELAKKCI